MYELNKADEERNFKPQAFMNIIEIRNLPKAMVRPYV
jgi:hypothetical protein